MTNTASAKKKDNGFARFFARKVNRRLVFALLLLAVVILAGIFAEQLAPYQYTKANFEDKLQGPSLKHIFGTDAFGRDLFSRVLCGLTIALRVALISMLIQLSLGIVIGLAARCV